MGRTHGGSWRLIGSSTVLPLLLLLLLVVVISITLCGGDGLYRARPTSLVLAAASLPRRFYGISFVYVASRLRLHVQSNVRAGASSSKLGGGPHQAMRRPK